MRWIVIALLCSGCLQGNVQENPENSTVGPEKIATEPPASYDATGSPINHIEWTLQASNVSLALPFVAAPLDPCDDHKQGGHSDLFEPLDFNATVARLAALWNLTLTHHSPGQWETIEGTTFRHIEVDTVRFTLHDVWPINNLTAAQAFVNETMAAMQVRGDVQLEARVGFARTSGRETFNHVAGYVTQYAAGEYVHELLNIRSQGDGSTRVTLALPAPIGGGQIFPFDNMSERFADILACKGIEIDLQPVEGPYLVYDPHLVAVVSLLQEGSCGGAQFWGRFDVATGAFLTYEEGYLAVECW